MHAGSFHVPVIHRTRDRIFNVCTRSFLCDHSTRGLGTHRESAQYFWLEKPHRFFLCSWQGSNCGHGSIRFWVRRSTNRATPSPHCIYQRFTKLVCSSWILLLTSYWFVMQQTAFLLLLWRTFIGAIPMVIMAQSTANWCNMHTHMDHTHSNQHSCNHVVRSASSAISFQCVLGLFVFP